MTFYPHQHCGKKRVIFWILERKEERKRGRKKEERKRGEKRRIDGIEPADKSLLKRDQINH